MNDPQSLEKPKPTEPPVWFKTVLSVALLIPVVISYVALIRWMLVTLW